MIDWSPTANDHDNVTVRAERSRLDAIEKAIRNAFEKGNAEDRTFRERVYRSAFAALDRALQANPGVTVEVAIKRRKAVQAKITEIESEFLPAVPDVGPPTNDDAAAPAAEQPADSEVEADAEAEADTEPDVEADAGPAPSPDVVVDGPVEPRASDAPRSRVLPVVPDIMPEAVSADVPEIDMSSPASTGVDDTEVMPDRDERRVR
ncbi:MAG: hypothetical protein E5W87_30305, partial [Mesorhizobium sp.]